MKQKLNYFRLGAFIVFVVALVFIAVKLVSNYKYKQTYEYKLLDIGYSADEIEVIESEFKDSEIDNLLKHKYNSNIVHLISEKYFLYDRLNDYLEYLKENKVDDFSKVVSLVNTFSYVEWIDEKRDTDTEKNELMLVNRLYGLSSDYEPEDIVDIPQQYAYVGKKISKSILENIISLIAAGKEAGYTFVVDSGYRSYKEQESIYNSFKDSYGISEADKLVARPGHSEYQTGLSFELVPYNKVIENPYESEEYLWLKDNAYKYGFIFRLPKEKEDITKFSSSAWRLRYVGYEAASLIHNENISFEEYYFYFVER